MSFVTYKDAGRAASPSDSIWGDVPVLDWIKNPGKGIHIFDDFEGAPVTDDAGSQVNGRWLLLGTNADLDGSSVDGATAEETVIQMEGGGADNDECYLVSNTICTEAIKKNSGRRVWFEIRLKFEDADVDQAFLAGLAEAEGLVDDAIADDGADIIDKDFIGFLAVSDATNMGNINAVYRQDGGSTTTVIAAATNSGTTLDDTYMKLGLKFDGVKTVTFYKDGAALGTTLDVDDLTSDKLDDPLGIIFGIKETNGGQKYMAVDWVRFACDKYSLGHTGV